MRPFLEHVARPARLPYGARDKTARCSRRARLYLRSLWTEMSVEFAPSRAVRSKALHAFSETGRRPTATSLILRACTAASSKSPDKRESQNLGDCRRDHWVARRSVPVIEVRSRSGREMPAWRNNHRSPRVVPSLGRVVGQRRNVRLIRTARARRATFPQQYLLWLFHFWHLPRLRKHDTPAGASQRNQ